jgi:predicted dehydrogenase
VFCMEALMYRCHPLITKLSEMIKQNKLGDIKQINATYTADIASLANQIAGGSILNLGCYPVSLIRLLIGWHLGHNFAEPVEMKSIGRFNSNMRDHQASALLKFENNIIATVSTADDIEMNYQFEIYGSKGRLRFMTNPWLPTQDNNRFDMYLYDQDMPMEIYVTADKPLYTYQIDAVNQHIISGDKQSYFISWQDSIGNMTVLHTWLQQIHLHALQYDNSVEEKEK